MKYPGEKGGERKYPASRTFDGVKKKSEGRDWNTGGGIYTRRALAVGMHRAR